MAWYRGAKGIKSKGINTPSPPYIRRLPSIPTYPNIFFTKNFFYLVKMNGEKRESYSVDEVLAGAGRLKIRYFAEGVYPSNTLEAFHKSYYDILDKFADGEIKNLIITMPPQHGKELADSEVVMTPNGFKKHGDLVAGDYVFSPSGNPIKVLGEIPQEELCSILVTFSNGQKIKCHPNHEWNVIRNRAVSETIETKSLLGKKLNSGEKGKRGSRYIYQLPEVKCLKISEKKIETNPYCLGAWLGDGGSSAPSIHARAGENEVLDYFTSLYEPTSTNIHSTTGVVRISYSRSKFHNGLKEDGLLNNKHIPINYILNTKEIRLDLLAGLIDTDGSLHRETGQYRFINTNKILIDNVCLLLKTLGYSYSLTSAEPRKEPNSFGIQDRKVCYQIGFTPLDVIPCKIPRKQIDKKPLKRKVSIVSVEVLPIEDHEKGKCIEVEGGLYLVGTNLIPTHNSEGSTRLLPAKILGNRPDTKIAVISYAATFARKFNRSIQRIIESDPYKLIFPDTKLNSSSTKKDDNYLQNSEEFEIVGKSGGLKAVGRGGALTGNTVDVAIMDDLYKDASEGNSPIIRAGVIEYYASVIEKRLHNNSQQLIVFTRWHEQDLIGYLEDNSTVVECHSMAEIQVVMDDDIDTWVKVNYEAIKETPPTEFDPRKMGEALWESKHSIKKLKEERQKSRHVFECMNQGKPAGKEGQLYGDFMVWENLPNAKKRGNYTDTADMGSDHLCSICYEVGFDKIIRITDILYTQEPMEKTEIAVPQMLRKNKTVYANIESNNGGRGFGREIQRRITGIVIRLFFQSKNKESRILTNAPSVTQNIMMPYDWEKRFPKFYNDVTRYKRIFKANQFDDAPDALTGIVEKEVFNNIEEPLRVTTY